MRRIHFYREKNTFSKFSKSIICMDILTLSPLLIYEGRSKILQVHFILHQVHKPGKEPPCVDKRNIDHIYINCWFAIYRWSEIEKTDTLVTPPPPPSPHTHTPIPVNVRVCDGGGSEYLYLPY